MRSVLRAALAACAIAFALGGCASVQTAWETVTTAKVSPTLVIVAGNTVDALESTATAYLKLAKCTGSNGPVCRSPSVTAKLIPAVRSMRVARNNLEQFLSDHPGQLATQGLYDAVQTSVRTVQDIIATYNIGGSK